MKRSLITAALLILATAGFTACPGPAPEPTDPPDAGPTWQPVQSATYKAEVGEWAVYDCPASNFERVETNKSVVLGQGGYPSRCLFAAKPIDISNITVPSKLRITLRQKSGPFKPAPVGLPYYTQVWLRVNAAEPGWSELHDSQIRPMALADNAENEVTAEFTMASGMKTLDLVLGVDPKYITLTRPEDHPAVELKAVKLEVLQ